jgi:hypothetical protein
MVYLAIEFLNVPTEREYEDSEKISVLWFFG